MLSKLKQRLLETSLSSAVVLLARVLHNLNGFLLSIVVVRRFGLSAGGSLALASTGTIVLSTLCTFGLPYVFARLDVPIRVRNFIGLLSALAGMILAAPIAAALGLIFGRSLHEAGVIFLLSMGGCYFAQTTISSSLLVLQDRAADMVLSPLGGLAGLLAGYFLARDPLSFAIIVAASRVVGGFAAFCWLPVTRIPVRTALGHIRDGMKYLAADSANLVSDQVSVMLASALLSRADLGLLGLCRQIIAVSDTPAFSTLILWYPRVCENARACFPSLLRRMLLLGIGCMVTLSVLIFPVALWVYHLPQLVWLALLMLCSVPFRYMIGCYESLLQALGAFRDIRTLAICRCLFIVVIPLGVHFWGVHGAIVATIVQMAATVALVRPLAYSALDAVSPTPCKQAPMLSASST